MKQIHRLILKSYIGPLFVTFFIALFFLLMQFLWKWVEDFIGKGLEWNIIAKILFYASSNLVPLALPLGILLASLMTFGNLGERYELTAIKAAGISLMKSMRSLIVLTVIMSIGAFFFSNNVLPYTNLELAKLLYDVSRKRPELNLKTGIFNNDIEGYSIKIGSKNQETGMMYDFMIYNHFNKRGNKEVILADSGTITITPDQKRMMVSLFNGRSFNELNESKEKRATPEYPHRHDKFESQTIKLELAGFEMKESDAGIFKNNYQMMNLDQLSYVIDSLYIRYEKRKNTGVGRLLRYNYAKYDSKEYLRELNFADSADVSVPFDAAPISDRKMINTDSVFNAMSPEQKQNAVALALENVKRTTESIDTETEAMHDRIKWIRKHELAWYRKFSMSFACLIFFFIGAPLGAIIRKGGFGMPILISIILFMVYYVMTMAGEKFAREDIIPVFAGAWLSTFVLFPLGVFLTYKSVKDSTLFDANAIKSFFVRMIKPFAKKMKIEQKDQIES